MPSNRRCFPCECRLRNLIDQRIHDLRATGIYTSPHPTRLARDVWQRLPVVGFPLPTIPELATHIRHDHMRSPELIARLVRDEKEMIASIVDIGPGLTDHSMTVTPKNPPRPKRPKRRSKSHWSPQAMRSRQQFTGWTPEEQIALREAQGNICKACGSGPPDYMDFEITDTDEGYKRVTVYGFICARCRIITRTWGHDRTAIAGILAMWDNPPARMVG